MKLPAVLRTLGLGPSTRAAALLSAGATAGLFVSHLAGELVPDGIANAICMFAFGALAGVAVGRTHSPRPGAHIKHSKRI